MQGVGRCHMSDPTTDDMANDWGTGLVESSQCAESSFIKLDCKMRQEADGFRVLRLVDSGTSANSLAVELLTGGNFSRCLIGMGSYGGGEGVLHGLSTSYSMTNHYLSFVKHPDESTIDAQKQTVALPYHIPDSGFTNQDLEELETRCLAALSEKLMLAVLNGYPYKAFLIEYILSGSGGQLSIRFLEKMGRILSKHKVTIIADEVMTFGRVGPGLVITTTMPSEFKKNVGCITIGKAVGCGMVMQNTSKYINLDGRGTTTKLPTSEALAKIKLICNRMKEGLIDAKRKKVFEATKLSPNDVWGAGLMIFTSKARPGIYGGLKCRCLPRLENSKGTKIQLGFKETKFTKSVVNTILFDSAEAWLNHVPKVHDNLLLSPYIVELATFLSKCSEAELVFPEDFQQWLPKDSEKQEQLRQIHLSYKRKQMGGWHGRCSAKHSRLANESMKMAAAQSNGFLTEQRKTKKRKLCYKVDYSMIQW